MICVPNMATEGYLLFLHSLTSFGRALPLVAILSRTQQDLFGCKKACHSINKVQGVRNWDKKNVIAVFHIKVVFI